MLGLVALSTSQLPVALKPTAGWEEQLFISTTTHADLGTFNVTGLNSGVWNANVAGALQLASAPQELMAIADIQLPTNGGVLTQKIVLTVTGLDKFGVAYTGVATFQPPAWTQTQELSFPKTWAVDLLANSGNAQQVASISSVTVACDGSAVNAAIRIVSAPSPNTAVGTAGAYRLVSLKNRLETTPRQPGAHPVQDGRDEGAFVKLGTIPAGRLMITTKDPTAADGLRRISGQRVTGLIKTVKEGVVETGRTYLFGMVLTYKPSSPEGVENKELSAEGFYEIEGTFIAG